MDGQIVGEFTCFASTMLDTNHVVSFISCLVEASNADFGEQLRGALVK